MTELKGYKGGQKWGFLEDGTIVSDIKPISIYTSDIYVEDCSTLHAYRTKGEPLTAHTALRDFGAAMEAAAEEFGVSVPVIFATMCIEATKWKDDKSHFDPRCIRFEPGFESDVKTPNKVSPGLMQTLISTAQEMNNRFKLFVNLDGSTEKLTREDLQIAERSIRLGTCYLRYQFDRVEDDEMGFLKTDPVLAWSAYNAGSVRFDKSSPWKLVTYGEGRIDKAIAYHNDMIALLKR